MVALGVADSKETNDSKNHKKRGVSLGSFETGFDDHGLELGGHELISHDDHVKTVTITKKVPYPVPHPVPYPVIKHVPVPYKVCRS